MPKGEHFKKPNPRINQVSFKVSDKELSRLQSLAALKGLSVPEWIRVQINYGAPVEVEKPVVAPEVEAKAEEIPVKDDSNRLPDEPIKNQMSLF